jgi:hypothetical protein
MDIPTLVESDDNTYMNEFTDIFLKRGSTISTCKARMKWMNGDITNKVDLRFDSVSEAVLTNQEGNKMTLALQWDDYTWRNRKPDLILTKLSHIFLL